MGRGTLRNSTSGGQGSLSAIAAVARDGGKEGPKELRRFPTVNGKGEIREVAQVSWFASRALALQKWHYVMTTPIWNHL